MLEAYQQVQLTPEADGETIDPRPAADAEAVARQPTLRAIPPEAPLCMPEQSFG